jgi:SAM-dependent methyltransferase
MSDPLSGPLSSCYRDLIEEWRREERRPFCGWDFSYLDDKWKEERPPWSYVDRVRSLLPGASSLLDLGTGGGEKLLKLRALWPPRVAVTEGYAPNLSLVRERLEPLGVQVVQSETPLYDTLPFEDNSFDLVIDRHSGFNIVEVERTLAPGGTFLTQQVEGTNMADLSAAFDCQQPWTHFTLDYMLDQIRETHLVVEVAQGWSGKTRIRSVGALVYFLKAVPWIVEGFSVDTHLPYLLKLQQRLEREGTLEFTTKSMLVQARKPGRP